MFLITNEEREKEQLGNIRIQLICGMAKPGAPVSPTFASFNININEFCKQFNEKSKAYGEGNFVTAVVKIYKDKRFEIVIKPASISQILESIGSTKSQITKELLYKIVLIRLKQRNIKVCNHSISQESFQVLSSLKNFL
jgi:large subunit ribosomal protein L11